MKTKILLAAVAGALVMPVPLVSQADVMSGTDFSIYGRVVAGVDRQDSDVANQNATWDLGATGRDGSGEQQSRIGLKADRDIGFMTVGFKMEQGILSGGNAGFNTRHRYVYMSGDFGTITIGQQDNPYLMGANWAQEWYLGGNTVGNFRDEGIGYAWSNGTFDLNVLLTGNDGNAAAAAGTPEYRTADETIDRTIIGASYDFGVVKVGFGYNADNTENEQDWTAIGVSGTVDAFEYYVGYQTRDDARQRGAANTTVGIEDQVGWGAFLAYSLSDSDKIYMEYETLEDDYGMKEDTTYTLFGYSHDFGGSTRFIAEYLATDNSDKEMARPDPSRLTLTVMVSF